VVVVELMILPRMLLVEMELFGLATLLTTVAAAAAVVTTVETHLAA
jgi:hypothetical protein